MENGAYLNGNRISVNNRKKRMVGNINLEEPESLRIIESTIKQRKDIEFRALYCAASIFGYIASGVFDFSIHIGRCGIWDIIAPKLLVEEAGGTCKFYKDQNNKNIVIAGKKQNIEMLENIIRETTEN